MSFSGTLILTFANELSLYNYEKEAVSIHFMINMREKR